MSDVVNGCQSLCTQVICNLKENIIKKLIYFNWKTLLQLEDFQAEILNPHTNLDNEFLFDFCDASLFKTHPLFSIDVINALQIVAYYDELEVVYPIGSYVKRHKVGCIFFFFGNVRPQFRSTLKSIHLVSVGKHILHYGIDTLLLPFIDDLKTLYCDGVTVSITGNDMTFYGGLLAFLADNLAAHQLGGFKLSMSFALRVCRTCMITPESLQTCFSESNCTLRTVDTHFEQCSLLEGTMETHHSVSYGVTRLSILEEVPGFSVIHGLPHDIMHDLYEGVVPLHLKLLMVTSWKASFLPPMSLMTELTILISSTINHPCLIPNCLKVMA